MADIKNLFGKVSIPENLPVELQVIVAEMRQERVAYQSLADRTKQNLETFEKLAEPFTNMQRGMREMESRMRSLEKIGEGLAPQVNSVQARLDSLIQSQRDGESQLGRTADEATQLAGQLDELRRLLDSVMTLKTDLTGFLELEGPFNATRSGARELQEQLESTREQFDRMREQQAEITHSHELALPKLQEFDAHYQKAQSGVENTSRRVAELENAMEHVSEVASAVPDLSEQLNSFKSLATYVTQKTTALEQQRDGIDRAIGEATRLGDLSKQVDSEIQKRKGNQRFLDKLEVDTDALKTLHIDLLERSKKVSTAQQTMERNEDGLRNKLTTLRDEMHAAMEKAVGRFEMERRGLDSVSQRVSDLRGGLSEFEKRFHALDESDKVITEVNSRVEHLSSKVVGMATDIAHLDVEIDKIPAARSEAERIDRLVRDVKTRFDSIHAPAVLAAVEQAEQRVSDVDTAVSALEVRSQNVEGLAERMAQSGKELGVRQHALEGALEQLERSSKLRQEASAAAQQLAEQARKLNEGLSHADERSTQLTELLDNLDDRAGKLRFVQKRMAQFEDRMAKWELAERQLSRALDQASERQISVDAIQVDIKRVFEMAERTVEDVRTFTAARHDIERHSSSMKEALEQLGDVDSKTADLTTRQQQIAQAEKRLARTEATLIDIQSSVETVHAQKALLDQVVGKMASLTFQSKQAEGLIEMLRDEREMVQRVQTAVEDSHEDLGQQIKIV